VSLFGGEQDKFLVLTVLEHDLLYVFEDSFGTCKTLQKVTELHKLFSPRNEVFPEPSIKISTETLKYLVNGQSFGSVAYRT
jgi:hypothetical protein